MEFIDRLLPNGINMTYAWFEAMHTRMDIVLWSDIVSDTVLHSICRSVKEEAVRIELMASCFLTESEVSGINSSPVGEKVKLSEEMFSILERCIIYNRSTDGMFDIAVSAGKKGVSLEDKICLDKDTLSASRLAEDIRLNLSGFLKGYALDKAVSIIRNADVDNALVSFGNSSVYAIGNHPGGNGWPVATEDGEEYVLMNECLTTSGNSREDRKHIINPLTGEYVEGRSMTSVITATAEEGEVMSTTSFLKKNTTTNNPNI